MAKINNKKKGANGQKHRIFLLEDHLIFREGLSKVLNAEVDLTVCGEAGDAQQALESVIKLQPDLTLVDIGLPGKSGLEFIKEIRALKFAGKLLAVSMFDEAIYAQRVLRAGGDGYIMKQEDPDEIVHAIRDVLAGHIYVSENVFARNSAKAPSQSAARFLDLLTDMELEVLESLGKDKTTEKISAQFGLTETEVQPFFDIIRRKLKIKTHEHLVQYAVDWVQDSRKEPQVF